MATQSKPAFDANIQRARRFLEIHEDVQQGAGAPPLRYRELPRAAIVFAVGAVDAYLSEVSAKVMVRQLQADVANNATRETLRRVQQELPTLAIVVSVLATNPERILRIREAIADHFHNKVSNHGPRAVAAAMERIGHNANEVWNHLTNQGYQQPADRLEHWTSVRHNIVHRGQRPSVHRPHAKGFIAFVDALIARIDHIAENA